MIRLRGLIICILLVTLFPTTCNNNAGIENGNNEVKTDMINDDSNNADIDVTNIDLRAYNEEKKKTNIDVLLDKVKNYPAICTISDFLVKDEYAGFILTNTNIVDGDTFKKINARYRLKSNNDIDDYDAKVTISFYDSKSANHTVMRNSLDEYTAMKIYPSALDIGDFAIGDSYYLNYIRGNVFVTVIECPGNHINEIEIDALARAIDTQILEIITKA